MFCVTLSHVVNISQYSDLCFRPRSRKRSTCTTTSRTERWAQPYGRTSSPRSTPLLQTRASPGWTSACADSSSTPRCDQRPETTPPRALCHTAGGCQAGSLKPQLPGHCQLIATLLTEASTGLQDVLETSPSLLLRASTAAFTRHSGRFPLCSAHQSGEQTAGLLVLPGKHSHLHNSRIECWRVEVRRCQSSHCLRPWESWNFMNHCNPKLNLP